MVPWRRLKSCPETRVTSVPHHPSHVPKQEAQPKTQRCPQTPHTSLSKSIMFPTTHVGWDSYWTPQSLIRPSKVVIVVFQDRVSKETIDKYAADVVAHGKDIWFGLKLWSWYINPFYRIGGKIKDRYYESKVGINVGLTLQWHLRTCASTFVDIIHLNRDSLPLLSISKLSRLLERIRLTTSVRFSVPASAISKLWLKFYAPIYRSWQGFYHSACQWVAVKHAK